MNEDLVNDEKQDDESRPADAQRVITGPALKQLRHGDIIRHGVHYNVDYDGPDNSGFKWNPDDLTLPIHEILLRYDQDIADDFVARARKMEINGTTVWNWLTGSRFKPRSNKEIARQDAAMIRKNLEKSKIIIPD